MTTHETTYNSSPTSRRRHSLSITSARSTSNSKRPPSPIVTFTASPLSSDTKGVKNITRKVIKTLGGLCHIETTDMDEQDCDSDEKHDPNEIEIASNGTIHNARHLHYSSSRLPKHLGATHIDICNHNSVLLPTPDSNPGEYKKIDWEIPRKIFHSSIGFFTIYLYIIKGDVKTIILVLWTALAVIVPADILRLNYPPFERLYERCLGFLMRESEKKTTNGVIWYILGVNFTLTFYPLDIATVAILILSWADTAASTFGRLLGSKTARLPPHTPLVPLPLAPRKSLAGFIAASLTGTLIAVSFWSWVAPLRGIPLSWSWDGGARVLPFSNPFNVGLRTSGWLGLGALGAFTGLVSGIAEALDLGPLDDNLTLPIISGGCILGFLKLLGLFSLSSS